MKRGLANFYFLAVLFCWIHGKGKNWECEICNKKEMLFRTKKGTKKQKDLWGPMSIFLFLNF